MSQTNRHIQQIEPIEPIVLTDEEYLDDDCDSNASLEEFWDNDEIEPQLGKLCVIDDKYSMRRVIDREKVGNAIEYLSDKIVGTLADDRVKHQRHATRLYLSCSTCHYTDPLFDEFLLLVSLPQDPKNMVTTWNQVDRSDIELRCLERVINTPHGLQWFNIKAHIDSFVSEASVSEGEKIIEKIEQTNRKRKRLTEKEDEKEDEDDSDSEERSSLSGSSRTNRIIRTKKRGPRLNPSSITAQNRHVVQTQVLNDDDDDDLEIIFERKR